VQQKKIRLTLKEFEILKLFMENSGLVFTKEHLLQSVWGEAYLGETRTVDVHIGTLRTKLGDCRKFLKLPYGFSLFFCHIISLSASAPKYSCVQA